MQEKKETQAFLDKMDYPDQQDYPDSKASVSLFLCNKASLIFGSFINQCTENFTFFERRNLNKKIKQHYFIINISTASFTAFLDLYRCCIVFSTSLLNPFYKDVRLDLFNDIVTEYTSMPFRNTQFFCFIVHQARMKRYFSVIPTLCQKVC